MAGPLSRLPYPYRNEHAVVTGLLAGLGGYIDWTSVASQAKPWVQGVREHPAPFWVLESLLKEYPISSAEGLALMRLSEALLRVPDAETAMLLTADQLRGADFKDGSQSVLASLSSAAIALSNTLLPDAEHPGMLQRLGAQTVVAAAVRGIQLLGRQFVLGRDMSEALAHADAQRGRFPPPLFSFDMLGEGARTEQDARCYFASYRSAIAAIAAHGTHGVLDENDGISIKLSALFSRYEAAHHGRVMAELLPSVVVLADAAAAANINLTMDAEESDRLELSLDVLEAVARHAAQEHPHWRGLGLAVQAYQTRALDVVEEVARLARKHAPGEGRLLGRRSQTRPGTWAGELSRLYA